MKQGTAEVILVVDDDEMGRYGTTRILRRAGFTVWEASTGAEALELGRRLPNLVVLDVNLPDISGFEVCRRLRSDPLTCSLAILHLSATRLGAKDRAEGLEAGADGYLTFPVEPEELVATVRALLRVKHAEERARRRASEWDATFDAISDPICMAGPDGLVLRTNVAFRELAADPAHAIVADCCEELRRRAADLHGDDSLAAAVAASRREPQLRQIKDRWFRITVDLIRPEAGDGRRLIFVFADVTAQRKAAEALRHSEEKYRLLAETTRDIILVHDLKGKLLYVNRTGLEQSGFTPAEARRKTVSQLIPPGRSQSAEDGRSSGGPGAQQRPLYEAEFVRQDGERIPVEVNSTSTLWEGETPAVLLVVRDIQERKRSELDRQELETQLVQAHKMEAIGRLAGGVAHDFNNYLTIINGYGDLLLEGLPAAEPLRAFVQPIRESGERAACLTRQLLAFSRKQLIQPKVLSLNQVIEEAETMLRRMIGEDIEITGAKDPDLGGVLADLSQLQQVVLNLAINARDAMPEGGRLIFETSNVEFGPQDLAGKPERRPGSFVLLTVTDTGVGISAETLRHVFEPFFTTKEFGGGTGLGLATVHGIVHQAGGWITADSAPGKGSTFRVYLPRVAAAAPAPEEAVAPTAVSAPCETALVVEDQPEVRSLTALILRNAGYLVLEAPDGAEALRLFAHYPKPIHLLVADVIMPGMSGLELSRQLREARPSLQVLFVSGYTADIIARKGLLEDGSAFLPKPFTPEQLLGRARHLLEHSAAA